MCLFNTNTDAERKFTVTPRMLIERYGTDVYDYAFAFQHQKYARYITGPIFIFAATLINCLREILADFFAAAELITR